jgi:hypothetical protein
MENIRKVETLKLSVTQPARIEVSGDAVSSLAIRMDYTMYSLTWKITVSYTVTP